MPTISRCWLAREKGVGEEIQFSYIFTIDVDIRTMKLTLGKIKIYIRYLHDNAVHREFYLIMKLILSFSAYFDEKTVRGLQHEVD